jgi:hypothetical protein
MPIVTPKSDEDYCRQTEPNTPFDQCLSTRAEVSARIVVRYDEIGSRCSAAFPKDVAKNNECRTFCWARNDDAASCTAEVVFLLNNQRELEEGQRNHVVTVGAFLLAVAMLVVIIYSKRTRSALLRFTAPIARLPARLILAVSGFDARRIHDRWNDYRQQDRSVQHPVPVVAEAEDAGAPTSLSTPERLPTTSGKSVALLNVGRFLMWMWIINGVGHLLLGPPVIGQIPQPYYTLACIAQIGVAIFLLSLMTRAIRVRRLNPGQVVQDKQPSDADK